MELLLQGCSPTRAAITFHHRLNLHLNHRPTPIKPSPSAPPRFTVSFARSGAVRIGPAVYAPSAIPDITEVSTPSSEWLRTSSRRAFAICGRPIKFGSNRVKIRSLVRAPPGIVRFGLDSGLWEKNFLILRSPVPALASSHRDSVHILSPSPPSVVAASFPDPKFAISGHTIIHGEFLGKFDDACQYICVSLRVISSISPARRMGIYTSASRTVWHRTGIGTLRLAFQVARGSHFDNDSVHRVKLRCFLLESSSWRSYSIQYTTLPRVGTEVFQVHRSTGTSSYHTHPFLFRLYLALTGFSQCKPRLLELLGYPTAPTCASPFGMFLVLGCIGILASGHVYHRRLLICFPYYLWFSLISLWYHCVFTLIEVPSLYTNSTLPPPFISAQISPLANGYRAGKLVFDMIKLNPLDSLATYLSIATSSPSLPSLEIELLLCLLCIICFLLLYFTFRIWVVFLGFGHSVGNLAMSIYLD